MGRADARGFLMGCHEPLAGCWGSALDWRGLLWCRPGRAGGHFEMLQALRWIGWRGCDVVARWSQRRETWWDRGDALRRAMHVGGRRDVGGTGGKGLR